MSTENTELLRRYLAEKSETAFTELVRQNIDLVYSAALRQVDFDSALAQDVTQGVFTDLARRASSLARHSSLIGWLYTSTRYLAAKARRSEQRRRARELQAHVMNEHLNAAAPDPAWHDLRPVLDDAMHDLATTDREAVLMRYFEGRPLAEIGTRLGLSENAARMRVDRAVDKLRVALVKRGVSSTAAALALVLSQRAVSSAPAGLAATVSHNALNSSLVPGGLVAALLTWLATWKSALLVGGAALILLSAAGLAAKSKLQAPAAIAPSATEQAFVLPTGSVAGASATNPPAPSQAKESASAPDPDSTNRLTLLVVAADSGQPIPDVEFDFWNWDGDPSVHRHPLRASRKGVCVVPLVRDRVNHLILVSRSDGFADTRLEWHPDRGERIPQEYTLRVARSVPIGGTVVDEDEKPVAGAEVGFNNRTDAAQEGAGPQTDNFGWPFWMTATTDAQGRWRIDRLAANTLRTLDGAAQHPQYVRSDSVSLQRMPEAEKQLKEERYVFHLKSGLVVNGIVVDPHDQPVANAHVLVGRMGESGSRETTTAADGTFSIAGCRSGQSPLTAEAKGFAPVTLEVNLSTNSEPFRLTLQPARTLRLRALSKQGQPIAGASVWLNTFDWGAGFPDANSKTNPVPQVEFSQKTDAEGRVVWESAPDQLLSFDLSASGYMRKSAVKVQPDGEEHAITLAPGLTISGTVRDASSSQPIPRFRIITGWPKVDHFNNETNFQWSSLDRFWLNFDGGKFRHVFEEPVIVGEKPYGFAFKFEAEGYAPTTTRAVAEDEGEVRFDIALQPASNSTVTVLLPDGSPAVGADVGLISVSSGLQLRPGGFDRGNVQSGGSLLETDAHGEFKLPPDNSIRRIVAAHPEGFAEATPANLSADPTLRLQPWGRLEGFFKSSGRTVAGRSLLFQCGGGSARSLSSSFSAYQTKTDAEGHFVFPKVPPGKHYLVQLVETKISPGGIGWAHQPLSDVEIQAGETTSVVLGGCTVSARLRLPTNLETGTNPTIQALLRPPILIPPEETKSNPVALNAWRSQPETRLALSHVRQYFLTKNLDGIFSTEEVPAGDYQLVVDVLNGAPAGGPVENQAHLELMVTVPNEPPNGTLDLGELEVK